jgi:hypothetical protein
MSGRPGRSHRRPSDLRQAVSTHYCHSNSRSVEARNLPLIPLMNFGWMAFTNPPRQIQIRGQGNDNRAEPINSTSAEKNPSSNYEDRKRMGLDYEAMPLNDGERTQPAARLVGLSGQPSGDGFQTQTTGGGPAVLVNRTASFRREPV